jgi:hypothetical protein
LGVSYRGWVAEFGDLLLLLLGRHLLPRGVQASRRAIPACGGEETGTIWRSRPGCG